MKLKKAKLTASLHSATKFFGLPVVELPKFEIRKEYLIRVSPGLRIKAYWVVAAYSEFGSFHVVFLDDGEKEQERFYNLTDVLEVLGPLTGGA